MTSMVHALESLDSTRIDYLPSPTEIDRACARIRRQWTTNERRRRFVGPHLPEDVATAWLPPVVDTSAFRMMTMGIGSE